MDKEAANPESQVLFGGVDLEGLEDALLTVDIAEGETVPEVDKTVEEVASGGDGDPPKVTDKPLDKGSGDKPADKPPDLLEVDKKTEAAGGEKPKTDEGDKPKEGGEAGQEGTLSPMYLHAAALQENGLLPDFDLETIKDLETEDQALKVNEHIQKTINDEKKTAVDGALKEVNGLKEMYDDIKNGVDPNALRENMTLDEQYGNITVKSLEDNEEAQETIYSDVLLMKGLSEPKVKQLIQVSKDNESLLTDATDGLKEIQGAIKVEREDMRVKAKAAKDAREERSTKTQENVKKHVTGLKEIIPGVELTKAEQEKLIKDMTVPVKFVKNTQGVEVPVNRAMVLRSKDPIAFEARLNYFIEKGFFDKDAKFENLKATATTTAAKKFMDKINETKTVPGTPAVDEEKLNDKADFKFPFPT